jgi:hypothetical protein
MSTHPTAVHLDNIDTWLQHLADETDQTAQSAELSAFLRTVARFWT